MNNEPERYGHRHAAVPPQRRDAVPAQRIEFDLTSGPATPVLGWDHQQSMFSPARRSPFAPALAVHNGRLWCLFVDSADSKLYHATSDGTSWSEPVQFSDYSGASCAPALADVDGKLHAVFVENIDDAHDLVHYQYDDKTRRWGVRYGVAQHTVNQPAVAVFKHQLYCAWVADNASHKLLVASWNPVDGWTSQMSTDEASGGSPALAEINGELHLLFVTNDSDRKILDLVLNTSTRKWSRATPPKEATSSGVSATGFDGQGFLGFLEHAKSGSVYVCEYDKNGWRNHESVNQLSYDTPALAVLNKTLHCVFTARSTKDRYMLWTKRSVSELRPDNWMSSVDGTQSLFALSIPGTHDSCANTLMPIASTQGMSIADQLNAGIRFFDLRCILIDGILEMYHGIYPLGIALDQVLEEMYAWLRVHTQEALILLIKQEGDTVGYGAFDKAVAEHVDNDWWYTKSTVPSLDAVRGKLVLMRRYGTTSPLGIDLSRWPDDRSDVQIPIGNGVTVHVQDHYRLDPNAGYEKQVKEKWDVILPYLDAAGGGAGPLHGYLNFTSGVANGFPNSFTTPFELATGSWNPTTFAPGVNQRLYEKLVVGPIPRPCGVLVMDFPESPVPELVLAIIRTNRLKKPAGPGRGRARETTAVGSAATTG